MKKIPLTQGKVALVDDSCYKFLNQWKWYADNQRCTFYAARQIRKDGKKTTIFMHQVLAQMLGFFNTADHIDRDGLNNQINNLRDATTGQQNENRRLFKNNTSGCAGVYWHRQTSKWQAYINHHGKRIHLGYFDNKENAIAARKSAERKYFTHVTTTT